MTTGSCGGGVGAGAGCFDVLVLVLFLGAGSSTFGLFTACFGVAAAAVDRVTTRALAGPAFWGFGATIVGAATGVALAFGGALAGSLPFLALLGAERPSSTTGPSRLARDRVIRPV